MRIDCAPKVPFNFKFKTEMEKDIFAHFSFYFKIENGKMIKNFQFSFFHFNEKLKIENSFFMFQFLNLIAKLRK